MVYISIYRCIIFTILWENLNICKSGQSSEKNASISPSFNNYQIMVNFVSSFTCLLTGPFSTSLSKFQAHVTLSMKVKVAQSCLTLWDPIDCIVHGILQVRVMEW